MSWVYWRSPNSRAWAVEPSTSVNIRVSIPSPCRDARSRSMSISSSISVRVVVRLKPSDSSFGTPSEACHWTIRHTPASRTRTAVTRISTSDAPSTMRTLTAPHPTGPNSQPSMWAMSSSMPFISSIWAAMTGRKVSPPHHSSGSLPMARNSGPGLASLEMASTSPSAVALKVRVMTASISGDRRGALSGMGPR